MQTLEETNRVFEEAKQGHAEKEDWRWHPRANERVDCAACGASLPNRDINFGYYVNAAGTDGKTIQVKKHADKAFCNSICSSSYQVEPAATDMAGKIKEGRVLPSDYFPKPVSQDEIAARLHAMRDPVKEHREKYGVVY